MTKYIQVHKEDGSEEEIGEERVMEILSKNYNNPEEVLKLNKEINCNFCIIKVIKDETKK